MLSIAFESLYNNVFDGIYYSLSALSIILLSIAAYTAIRKKAKVNDRIFRSQAMGIALAAVGFALIIFSGVFLNYLSNSQIISEVLYQRAHFLVFYAAVALILYGIDSSLSTVKQTSMRTINRVIKPLRIAQWGVFFVTVVLAVFYLFSASLNAQGRLVQQPVFFLPLVLVVLLGLFEVPALAATTTSKYRKPLAWFGLTMILLLIGALREATIISLGDPLADLLLSFLPLTIASFGFFMSAKTLTSQETPATAHADQSKDSS